MKKEKKKKTMKRGSKTKRVQITEGKYGRSARLGSSKHILSELLQRKKKEWANVNEQDRIKIRRKNKGKENTLKN